LLVFTQDKRAKQNTVPSGNGVFHMEPRECRFG